MNKPLTLPLEIAEPVAPPIQPQVDLEQEAERRRWLSDDPDVIVQAQPALAVYANPYGSIVIRMESAEGVDEDPFVFCRPEYLPALIAALRKHLP